jgi:hypothetical protein
MSGNVGQLEAGCVPQHVRVDFNAPNLLDGFFSKSSLTG